MRVKLRYNSAPAWSILDWAHNRLQEEGRGSAAGASSCFREAPRPAPPGPTASITVEPSVVEAGQAVTLKWSTTNATAVTHLRTWRRSPPRGNRKSARRSPRPMNSSRTVRAALLPLRDRQRHGAAASHRSPPPPVGSKSLQDRMETELTDVYFDYDKSDHP